MARIKMVTRTIVSTNFECMLVNTETAEVSVSEFTLTGELTAEECKERMIENFKLSRPNTVPVKCTIINTIEELYGMTEEDFLANAKKLPPRTKIEE